MCIYIRARDTMKTKMFTDWCSPSVYAIVFVYIYIVLMARCCCWGEENAGILRRYIDRWWWVGRGKIVGVNRIWWAMMWEYNTLRWDFLIWIRMRIHFQGVGPMFWTGASWRTCKVDMVSNECVGIEVGAFNIPGIGIAMHQRVDL